MILFDITNNILVEGDSIEQLKLKRNECKHNRKPGTEFKRLFEIRAEKRKGRRVQTKANNPNSKVVKRINWKGLFK